MGNAAGDTAGWFLSSEENAPMVLRLNDVRHVKLRKAEDVQASIRIIGDDAQFPSLTKREPVPLSVGTDAVIVLRFSAVVACVASPSSNARAHMQRSRPLGDVRLQWEHVAQRCGCSLYHIWFPLSAPRPQRGEANVKVNLNAHPNSGETGTGDMLDELDRNLSLAAHDPRWPIVSLSLCPATSSEASRSMHDTDMGAAEKSLHFPALFASQAQQSRLLQALTQQQGAADLSHSAARVSPEVCAAASLTSGSTVSGDALSEEMVQMQEEILTTIVEASKEIKRDNETIRIRRDTQRLYHDANLPEVESQRIERMPSGPKYRCEGADGPPLSRVSPEVCAAARLTSGSADGGDALSEEMVQMQEKILTTIVEASSQIKQDNEAIRTLKEQISSHHLEHDQIRRDTQRLHHDAILLEVENQRIERSLQRDETSVVSCNGSGAMRPEDTEDEATRLRRDLEVLKEQKQALMLIVQDLYGAIASNGGGSGRCPALGTPEEQGSANAESSPGTSSGSVQNFPSADHGRDARGTGDFAIGSFVGKTAACGGASGQAWTNLLPRPSVLWLESELDGEY